VGVVSGHVLVVRLDNAGDVLLSGPAVRAVAAKARRVTFLAGPAGAAAARLLPGVDDVWRWSAPWAGFTPPPVDRDSTDALVDRIAAAGVDAAVILTSFHQSALPMALLLRLAGVAHVAATSVDYPGSLLDVRHPYVDELHEVEQALATCAAAGYDLPAGDDGRLLVRLPAAGSDLPSEPYVVVHPGGSVPARRLPLVPTADVVRRLAEEGRTVVVTGGPDERELTAAVVADAAPERIDDRTGRTDLAELAHILAGADAVVCANTGPAHLAAAVGTPVVEAFAPVVPAHRWRPWAVPHVLLGDQDIACAGCRARSCPIDGQPCLDPYDAEAVLAAVDRLAGPPVGAHPMLEEALR
jgi:ADP-heptose:LPS heptosyltransferase